MSTEISDFNFSDQELDIIHRIKEGDAELLENLWHADFERIPVSVEEFVKNDYYLGRSVKGLHGNWIKELETVFDPDSKILIWVLTGSIGCGKTTVSAVAICYMAYWLSCLRSPQEFFGLMPNSRIVFGIFNITLKKTDKAYELIRAYLENSPYFADHCPIRKRPKDPILFTNKNVVIDTGSLSTHALGDDMFGFMLDEANFYKKTQDPSQKTRAHSIFHEARTRLRSRFIESGGRKPGIILLLSSRKFHSSFLEEQERLASGQGGTKEEAEERHVSSFALWEVKDSSKISDETFRVVVGDDKLDSYVMEEDEIPPEGYEVVEVPKTFWSEFNEDPDLALRDIAGVATAGSTAFITRVESIKQAFKLAHEIEPLYGHPFTVETIDTLGLKSVKNLAEFLDAEKMFQIRNSVWRPIIAPSIPRYGHIDIGLTGDALGMGVGFPRIMQRGVTGVFFDFIVRIKAPAGDEVDLEAIVEFIKFLRSRGMHFDMITYDSYQSRHSIQGLIRAGFNAATMGLKLEHYVIAKSVMIHGGCAIYKHPQLQQELADLQKDPDGKRPPDHPPDGSNDLADCWAAVSYHCCQSDPVASFNQGEDNVGRGAVAVYGGGKGVSIDEVRYDKTSARSRSQNIIRI